MLAPYAQFSAATRSGFIRKRLLYGERSISAIVTG